MFKPRCRVLEVEQDDVGFLLGFLIDAKVADEMAPLDVRRRLARRLLRLAEQGVVGMDRARPSGRPVRATVTRRGMLSYDLRALVGAIRPDGHGGGVIEGAIPRSEVAWYARQLLAVGPDVVVQAPPALIAAICAQADAVAALYRRQALLPSAPIEE